MPELGPLAELGAIGLVVVLMMMVVDLIKHKVFGKDKHEFPPTIHCPNNVQGMGRTLERMLSNMDASTRMMTEMLHVVEENRVLTREVERVATLHGAGSRSEQIREESRDLLRELVSIAKKNGSPRKI